MGRGRSRARWYAQRGRIMRAPMKYDWKGQQNQEGDRGRGRDRGRRGGRGRRGNNSQVITVYLHTQ